MKWGISLMQQFNNDYYLEDYIVETCGGCDEDVVIYSEGVTYCPQCGKINSPCNACENSDCNNCEFIDSAGNVQPGVDIREISKKEIVWYVNQMIDSGRMSQRYARLLTNFD